MDFISVIIPAFNAERWLDKSLRSVMAAIDADCEVIIVNDGSTDGTRDIALRYADADPRVSLLDIDHVGPCAARKAGFIESQGDYIMFVDSDDMLPENSIRDQRMLLDYGADNEDDAREANQVTHSRPHVILGNIIERNAKDSKMLITSGIRALTGMEWAVETLTRSLPKYLFGHLFSRQLVEAIDWDDDPTITHHVHYYFMLSLAMKLHEWGCDERHVLVAPAVVTYHYLRRAGSQSALMALTPAGLERVWEHINELGLPEPELTVWGLEMIQQAFVERGLPFPNSYSVAADLRRRAAKIGPRVPVRLRELVVALDSPAHRRRIARRLARTGSLTSVSPHLSIIMVCNHEVGKVARSVDSIFKMGLRNLEVILVDTNNSYHDSVSINELSIRYPRVRTVKANSGDSIFTCANLGLKKCSGLCATFVRPGDLCCAEGLYDAVTRIDYGADAVLVNYRHFNPMTKLRSRIRTYSHLRSKEETRNAISTAANDTENVYSAAFEETKATLDKSDSFTIYGVVWRTETLLQHDLVANEFDGVTRRELGHASMRRILSRPMRIVTQDRTTSPAYEFATETLFRHVFDGPIAAFMF